MHDCKMEHLPLEHYRFKNYQEIWNFLKPPRLRPVVLVEIPCIFLMYFLLDISPKYTELAITSTILCIKFNVFFMLFWTLPRYKKKIPKSKIFAPNFQVLLRSYFCRTNLINIQVHINTYSNKTSHSNDQCSSQNIKCLPLVLLSVECNEEYKSGMLYSY